MYILEIPIPERRILLANLVTSAVLCLACDCMQIEIVLHSVVIFVLRFAQST